MPPKSTSKRSKPLEPLDEIVRLLVLNFKRERGLSEAIVELRSVGFERGRIAELLATSLGYVDVALARAKKPATRTSRGKRATKAPAP